MKGKLKRFRHAYGTGKAGAGDVRRGAESYRALAEEFLRKQKKD